VLQSSNMKTLTAHTAPGRDPGVLGGTSAQGVRQASLLSAHQWCGLTADEEKPGVAFATRVSVDGITSAVRLCNFSQPQQQKGVRAMD
jgi:hypothetical protein